MDEKYLYPAPYTPHIGLGDDTKDGYKDGCFACGIFDTTRRVSVDDEIDGNVDRDYESTLEDLSFNWWYRFLTYEN